MKTKQLINILKKELLDLEIYVSSDPEGNSFDKLESYGYLIKDKNGDFYNEDEIEFTKGGNKKVLVLWPG